MKRTANVVGYALALVLVAAGVGSETPPPPFMNELYPPELIMRHGREIELTPEQREAIGGFVKETQAETFDLQWEMQAAAQSLTEAMSRDEVDEKTALDAATSVMAIEGKVKRAHLRLLIRIKNRLTKAQQQKLRALRARAPH